MLCREKSALLKNNQMHDASASLRTIGADGNCTVDGSSLLPAAHPPDPRKHFVASQKAVYLLGPFPPTVETVFWQVQRMR